jgi:hypothetical protein
VFTARYALSPYIKWTRLVFKVLNINRSVHSEELLPSWGSSLVLPPEKHCYAEQTAQHLWKICGKHSYPRAWTSRKARWRRSLGINPSCIGRFTRKYAVFLKIIFSATNHHYIILSCSGYMQYPFTTRQSNITHSVLWAGISLTWHLTRHTARNSTHTHTHLYLCGFWGVAVWCDVHCGWGARQMEKQF